MDGQKKKSATSLKNDQRFSCTFCGVRFVKETTLLAHNCEPKRRRAQQNEVGVRLGYRCYQKFYNILRPTDPDKTYDEFADSSYYLAFVKFGRYLVEIKAVAPEKYCDWLLKKNKKLDQWTRDSFYEEYLVDHIKTEPATEALERTIQTMNDWATENSARFQDYFKYATASRICFDIQRGRISPWVIYSSNTGTEFLKSLSDTDLNTIWNYVDSDYWNNNLSKRYLDFEWATKVIQQAGI